nr:hypothetical protein HmN_000901000 [Hymenolepis microstoma]
MILLVKKTPQENVIVVKVHQWKELATDLAELRALLTLRFPRKASVASIVPRCSFIRSIRASIATRSLLDNWEAWKWPTPLDY